MKKQALNYNKTRNKSYPIKTSKHDSNRIKAEGIDKI
jgi:hypothetical protein